MVEIILIIVLLYLALGAVFFIPFLLKGIQKVDEGTRGSTIGFKIMIIPGVIVFWPVLLRKWLKHYRLLKNKIHSTVQIAKT
ncbi:MAG TPA: hypothetical protein VFX58_18270 [Chitinophagaceae bacterium]|nr:hypothetical protein [Chitinophagaceae bacterium]